jgi:radical SAM superfamily enzyme YgiQ (UPF0313 family)
MDLALVGAEHEENLALRYLAAAARAAGHDPVIIPFSGEDQAARVTRDILERGHPFVGLSLAFQHHGRDFLSLARTLRRQGYAGHVCCGGHWATAAWREILEDYPEVDSIVRHDGERTLVELLSVLGRPAEWGRVEGVCTRDASGQAVAAPPRRQVADLDEE